MDDDRLRRQADDQIFRIHSRYLGPPGYTLPFSIPYRGILPGLAAGAGTLILLSLFGLGLWRFIIAAGVAIAAAALADRYSGTDRPVAALPAILTHETGAPRPVSAHPSLAALRPDRVPVHPLPELSDKDYRP